MRTASDGERLAALDEWRATGFGIDELDTELLLASVEAFAGVCDDRQRAEELYELLRILEDVLAEHRNADLALALALGWEALRSPGAAAIEIDDLPERLVNALTAVPAIDAADLRDARGYVLASHLFSLRHQAGDFASAKAVAEDALARFVERSEGRAWLLANVADLERIAGTSRSAFARIEEAESIATKLGNRPELARTLASTRCQLEIACGLVEQAPASLKAERAAIVDGAIRPESRLSLLIDEAAVAMASMRPEALASAITKLEDALANPEEGYDRRPHHRAQVRARRALLTSLLEELRPVEVELAPARLAESFRDPALDPIHRAALGLKLVTRARRLADHAEARHWLDELDRLGPLQAELGAGVIASRALVDVASGKGRADLRDRAREVGHAYDEFLRRLADSPEREGGLGFLGWRDRRVLLTAMIELELALHGDDGPARALQAWMREEALGSLARQIGRPEDAAVGLDAIRERLLPDGIGLLVYVPGGSGGSGARLLCFDDQRATPFELDWRWDLEAAPRELRDLLAIPPDRLGDKELLLTLERIDALSAELGARLLPPDVQAWIKGLRGLYVVGSELLGGIPFECLPLGKQPIGLQLPISHLPSVAVGLHLVRRAHELAPPDSRLVLVAAPVLDPAVRKEREHLVDFALEAKDERGLKRPFEHATVLTGTEASARNWLQALELPAGASVAVLHLLVHGVSDGRRELPGGLALAPASEEDDGLLWCEELFDLTFTSPRLVVLASCDSARGPRRIGDDGIAQLSGVFLSKGALCTVEAVSGVALDPTIRLTTALSREIAAGLGTADAMLVARGELARDAELAHPFYSLSLRVVGLGFEPILPPKSPRTR